MPLVALVLETAKYGQSRTAGGGAGLEAEREGGVLAGGGAGLFALRGEERVDQVLAGEALDFLDALKFIGGYEAAVDVELAPVVEKEFAEAAGIDHIAAGGLGRRLLRDAPLRELRRVRGLAAHRVRGDLHRIERERDRLRYHGGVEMQIRHVGGAGRNRERRRHRR